MLCLSGFELWSRWVPLEYHPRRIGKIDLRQDLVNGK